MARCQKCGETLESLMFYALMIDAGARSSFDPLACQHDFGGALLGEKSPRASSENAGVPGLEGTA